MILEIGKKVQLKSDLARVGMIQSIGPMHGGMQYYEIFWGGNAGTSMISESDLMIYIERNRPSENLINGNLAKYQDFQRLITYHRLKREYPIHNNIYAFNASRTRFYPYQFKPLIKYLESPHHRILICDEVGLGKTIEAGLILTEMRARQTINRVLVIVPSNLKDKWRMELRRRFGEEFRILTSKDFLDYLEEYEEYTESSQISGIISLESCRTDRVLERLRGQLPNFDLIIIDEAHHMRNLGTKQRYAGLLLSQCANAMIMLTATPVHLGNHNLYSLLNILDDEGFRDQQTVDQLFRENLPIIMAQTSLGRIPPELENTKELLDHVSDSQWISDNPLYDQIKAKIDYLLKKNPNDLDYRRQLVNLQKDMSELNLLSHIFTRTRKREVQKDIAQRHAQAVELQFSPEELNFYNAVTDFVKAESRVQGYGSFIQQWILHMPQRQMASCIPAMIEYYGENLGTNQNDLPDDVYLLAKDQEIDYSNDLVAARERLQEIIRRWPKFGTDTKFLKLLEILGEIKSKEANMKILVFSHFKNTLRYLSHRLKDAGFKNHILSGDVKPDDRPAIIDSFKNDPTIELMLCSKVGSEGLDFQFCDTMINYDLPWNPMEVEQRIGRLDRIGQESDTITIWNFWVKDTIEERILRRLYERIGIFQRSIGDLEVIIGEIIQKLEKDIFSKDLTPEEQETKAEEAARVLERQLKDMEKLENDSAHFIGTDQYFLEEVEAIKNRRRYVTGEQLRRFTMDFIKRYTPRTRIKYDHNSKMGIIFPESDLIEFIRQRSKASELTKYLVPSAKERGIEISFDSTIAFEKPKIEFINVLHPLITTITELYTIENINLTNAHHVTLSTEVLKKGFYFYFIFLVKMGAARSKNSMECIILDQKSNIACDLEMSEIILGEMIEKGEDSVISIEIDHTIAQNIYNKANQLILQRIEAIRTDAEETNDAFIDRRLTSLKSSYDKNIYKQTSLLDIGIKKGSQERYLRMLRGTITRLKNEYAQKKNELEDKRKVSIEYDEIAAGIIEVA